MFLYNIVKLICLCPASPFTCLPDILLLQEEGHYKTDECKDRSHDEGDVYAHDFIFDGRLTCGRSEGEARHDRDQECGEQ